MPIVLVSTACVGLMLAYRRYVGERTCQIAALAMAVSPAMVFYGRYAIHESWMLFFLLLTGWGLPGLWQFGERKYLWATALGLTGLVLTKETYIIHFVAFALAVPCLLAYEKLVPSGPVCWEGGDGEAGRQSTGTPWRKFSGRDVQIVAAVCAGLILFFYTGGFLDWPALPGLWETFYTWVHTGVDKKSGHEKEWTYWLHLLVRYEWPAVVGFLSCAWLLWLRTPRVTRYLAIYGFGALIAYSYVPYKTPWCIISLVWPFYFVLGGAVVSAARYLDRLTVGVLAAVPFVASLGTTWVLNFHDYTDDNEPYVYVQTTLDVNQLLVPLQELVRRDPRNYQLRGHLILGEQYPFSWLLADYPQVDYPDAEQVPETLDADFLLIETSHVEKVEPLLRLDYYKLPMHIRGNSDSAATLYLYTRTFAGLVPEGTPIFDPSSTEKTEKPTETPAEKPAEAPAEKPTEKPAEKPAENAPEAK
jgi:uncharacterized protein (TIGR03663 family)